MARIIKFRAWEKSLEEIISVHDINFKTRIINTRSAWRLFDEIELMQFTGLRDKSGNEIYESDIVHWNGIHYKVCIGEFGLRDAETELVVDVVEGVYGEPISETVAPFCYPVPMNRVWIKHHGIEVIGNVYEHSHLLPTASMESHS